MCEAKDVSRAEMEKIVPAEVLRSDDKPRVIEERISNTESTVLVEASENVKSVKENFNSVADEIQTYENNVIVSAPENLTDVSQIVASTIGAIEEPPEEFSDMLDLIMTSTAEAFMNEVQNAPDYLLWMKMMCS